VNWIGKIVLRRSVDESYDNENHRNVTFPFSKQLDWMFKEVCSLALLTIFLNDSKYILLFLLISGVI